MQDCPFHTLSIPWLIHYLDIITTTFCFQPTLPLGRLDPSRICAFAALCFRRTLQDGSEHYQVLYTSWLICLDGRSTQERGRRALLTYFLDGHNFHSLHTGLSYTVVSMLVALYSPMSGATYLPEPQIWLGCLHHRDHQVLPPGARGVRTCGSHLLVISYTPDLRSGLDEPH